MGNLSIPKSVLDALAAAGNLQWLRVLGDCLHNSMLLFGLMTRADIDHARLGRERAVDRGVLEYINTHD